MFRISLVTSAFVLLLHSSVDAQTLAANPTSNNGSGGIFLNLTPTSSALQINSFDTMFGSASGSAVSVQVWTRPGTYSGFTASNAGWTLTQTVAATSAGTATLAPITLTTPVDLPLGDSTSVYLHSITTGGGIRYFGTGTTSVTTFSNADLALLTDISRTGNTAFAGTQFTPRAFTGNIHYTVAVPEPAILGVMGVVGLGWTMRRTFRTV